MELHSTTLKVYFLQQHKNFVKSEIYFTFPHSASISPIYEHVILGGGQEAMEVTTTSSKIGKFDARFFHMVYEDEEFARVKGHFGPINSLQFNPDGMSYASGGEDGYVRINTFDDSYHNFQF